MSGKTPGQPEYEAFRAAVPDWVCNVPAGPWDELSPAIQAGFAAVAAQYRPPAPELGAVAYEAAENAPLRRRIVTLEAHAASLEEDLDDAGETIAGYRDALTAMQRERDEARAVVREILAEVELGTLGQHTPQATARTLAKTAKWRKYAVVTDERDQLADALRGNPDLLVAALQSQVDHFRELLAEILAAFIPVNPALAVSSSTASASGDRLARWRERAGLED